MMPPKRLVRIIKHKIGGSKVMLPDCMMLLAIVGGRVKWSCGLLVVEHLPLRATETTHQGDSPVLKSIHAVLLYHHGPPYLDVVKALSEPNGSPLRDSITS